MPELKNYLNQRMKSLETEWQTWRAHYIQLSQHFYPSTGRFLSADRNLGHKRNKNIDNAGILARRTLQAGMVGGLTSPARPWFRLATPDLDMMRFAPVREWLETVENILRTIYNRSNLYNTLTTQYGEISVYGTAPIGIFENFDNVIRSFPFTVGSYYLAAGEDLKVNTLYRNIPLTVQQMVERFGLNNVSTTVRDMYNRGDYDKWIEVCQAIEPNNARSLELRDSINMPYRSIYWEKQSDKQEEFLSHSGFEEFPIMSPRWEITSTDTYGSSPGMDALGDAIQLQDEQKHKGMGIQKQVNPPMQAPISLQKKKSSTLPGNITFVDNAQGPGFTPAYQVNINLQDLKEDIFEVRQRISRAFYEDLFLMLAQSDRRQITAREVQEKHEEKLIMLGPVLERLQDELLDPLIDRTFNMALRAGILPPPPEELQGTQLQVEYVSILAQAQRAVGLSSIDRLLDTTAALAQVKPSALDVLDEDAVVREYHDALGVPQRILKDEKVVAQERQQRAQAQQAQQSLEMAQAGAGAMKDAAASDLEGDNALTRVLDNLGGGLT